MTIPLRWRKLAVAKRGHRPDEDEDAAAGDGARGRFAVADGATESAFAGDWSRLLAEAFVLDPLLPAGWKAWLPKVRGRWQENVGARDMPWYLEEKAEQGAFAAFLGLEIAPAEVGGGWHWKAIAVGDCCLFHLRGPELLCSFPVEAAAEFNSTPALIGSRSKELPRDHRARGRARAGDTFLLVSDALGQWALRRQEQNRSPWRELLELFARPEPDFAPWIEDRRERKELRNDDVTLVIVELPPSA
jgi:hypothetical protein